MSSCSDSGPGSLRQAVTKAGVGDTILLAASSACQTIMLTSGPIEIQRDVTITGPGPNELAISGDHLSSAFVIDAGSSASISGLTFEDAYHGALVVNSASLSLSFSTIIDSSSDDTEGVQNSGGNVKISNSQFVGAGGSYCCSPLENRSGGSMSVVNSSISHNDTVHDAGGITNGPSSFLRVTNTVIDDNNNGRVGGGIENGGSALLVNSTVSHNGSSGAGGGVLNRGSLTIVNSAFVSNGSTSGGGISNYGTLIIEGGVIAGNQADLGGGITNSGPGTIVITRTDISKNSATTGGALFNSGLVNADHCSFVSNADTSNDVFPGVFNDPQALPIGTLTIVKSSFS
ncbi:MAG TPA: hypothetical protein VGR71_15785 [Nitrospira sp.]|nr:hypothetical protein [Nitrospira sp.]